jgi:hypothetical protein
MKLSRIKKAGKTRRPRVRIPSRVSTFLNIFEEAKNKKHRFYLRSASSQKLYEDVALNGRTWLICRGRQLAVSGSSAPARNEIQKTLRFTVDSAVKKALLASMLI